MLFRSRTQGHAAERYLYELQRGRAARSHGIHGRAGFLIVTTETDYFRLRGGADWEVRYTCFPAGSLE